MRPEDVIDKGKLRPKPSDIKWWCLRKNMKVLRYKPRKPWYNLLDKKANRR